VGKERWQSNIKGLCPTSDNDKKIRRGKMARKKYVFTKARKAALAKARRSIKKHHKR
jgi:hypothetical protein